MVLTKSIKKKEKKNLPGARLRLTSTLHSAHLAIRVLTVHWRAMEQRPWSAAVSSAGCKWGAAVNRVQMLWDFLPVEPVLAISGNPTICSYFSRDRPDKIFNIKNLPAFRSLWRSRKDWSALRALGMIRNYKGSITVVDKMYLYF